MDLENKNVLVTGAGGFIGSHLVEHLLDNYDCRVKAFCFYDSSNSWGWLDYFPDETLEQIEIFTGDIRDPNGVRTAMEGIDVAFHLAALIGIPFSYHSPDSYIDTNVKGTLNVLQGAKDLDFDRVVVTSTSEVYGTAEYIPIDETHTRKAQSPYAASKIGADKIAESFARSFDLPVTTARPFNTFGPRQSARAVIPTIITQLLAGHEEIELGSLTPTRDFVYVKDTVEGFAQIAQTDNLVGEDCNIATEDEISIGDLAEQIIQLINPDAEIVTDEQRVRPDSSEVYRLYGSAEKLREQTGWSPDFSLSEGLQETIDWFDIEENRRGYKPGIYNI